MADNMLFPVPEEWQKRAFVDNARYMRLYKQSIDDPAGFWREQAKRLDWIKSPTKIKDVSYDAEDLHIRWFHDGTLNVSTNCIDRHLETRGDQTALLWEGDDPKDSRKISYRELHEEVCRFANVLKAKGVKRGDRVTHLHADDPGNGFRHACLRAHRRRSFGGLRRIFPALARGTHPGLPVPLRRHGRRRLARRQERAAEVEHRRGARGLPGGRHGDRRQAHGRKRSHDARTRPLASRAWPRASPPTARPRR